MEGILTIAVFFGIVLLISFLSDKYKENKIAQEKELDRTTSITSNLINELEELNERYKSKFYFHSDRESELKRTNWQKFKSNSFWDILRNDIADNFDYYDTLFMHVYENKKILPMYLKDCDELRKSSTYIYASEREKRLFEEHKLKPVIDPKFIVNVFYITRDNTTLKKASEYNYNAIKLCFVQQLEELGKKSHIQKERARLGDRLRYEIMERDGFRCVKCGRTADDGIKLHVDHIVPVSKGGRSIKSNLQTLCERCNLGKSNSYNGETQYSINSMNELINKEYFESEFGKNENGEYISETIAEYFKGCKKTDKNTVPNKTVKEELNTNEDDSDEKHIDKSDNHVESWEWKNYKTNANLSQCLQEYKTLLNKTKEFYGIYYEVIINNLITVVLDPPEEDILSFSDFEKIIGQSFVYEDAKDNKIKFIQIQKNVLFDFNAKISMKNKHIFLQLWKSNYLIEFKTNKDAEKVYKDILNIQKEENSRELILNKLRQQIIVNEEIKNNQLKQVLENFFRPYNLSNCKLFYIDVEDKSTHLRKKNNAVIVTGLMSKKNQKILDKNVLNDAKQSKLYNKAKEQYWFLTNWSSDKKTWDKIEETNYLTRYISYNESLSQKQQSHCVVLEANGETTPRYINIDGSIDSNIYIHIEATDIIVPNIYIFKYVFADNLEDLQYINNNIKLFNDKK